MSIRPGDIIGEYEIHKILSREGGMSRIYLAYETSRPDYGLAIKVSNAAKEGSDSYINFDDLLQREADILRNLYHPGIIRILPIRLGGTVAYSGILNQLPGRPHYFLMEYIAGDSIDKLATVITRRKFSIEWVFELFYQLLTTLHYIHMAGYAHCDLKPTNILLREPLHPDKCPLPVIIDFGSASRKGKIDAITKTLRYSPPELQVSYDNIKVAELLPRKIDVWSLGAILYELISGGPLINQTSLSRSSDKPFMIDLKYNQLGIDPHIEQLLQHMLANDPEKRPEIEDILQVVEQKIDSIRPPRIKLRRGFFSNVS